MLKWFFNVKPNEGGNMQSTLNPYLSFRDNAREAMEFYQTVFGGKLETQTFEESSSTIAGGRG
jgi:hypothetical protein